MRRSVRPFWPLGGPFLLRPAVLGEAPRTAPRQRHGVEVQMGVRLVCVLHHRAQPLAVLLPKPRHCRLTEPGPVLALLRGQGHHPSRQGEAIGAQLAPLGVLAAVGPVVGQLRGLCRGAAVQHLGRQGLGHVGAGVRLAHGLGGDLSRRPFARLAVLLGAMARVCLDVQELEAHGSSVAGLFS